MIDIFDVSSTCTVRGCV